jgi:NitT/TauT family transport system ATP-binding protein/nitrate/nitrite transport system substrate-binding protein
LAIVFPYSTHNYLLRDWLARAGVDPVRDVRLVVAPPSRMTELLVEGVVEGVCVTEPWGSAAVAVGAGRVAARGADFWPRTPDKVFAVTEAWAAEHPDALQGLLRALLRAAAWADDPANRLALAAILAQTQYVGADAAVIEASLAETIFAADGATAPQPIHAAWLLTQMRRWSHIGDEADIASVSRRVYRPDLHAAARAGLDLSEVPMLESLEGFRKGGFRLAGLRPPK